MAIDKIWVARTAAISLGAGFAAGFATDRILAWRERKEEDERVEEYKTLVLDEMYGESDEDSLYDDIPEGVNEEDEDAEPISTDYTKFFDGKPKKEEEKPVRVISSEEFVKLSGSLEGYDSVTGTWFSDDGILAGWDDSLEMKAVDATVGKTAISKFKDPEIEAVYVRNDILHMLYEIVRGTGSYDDAREESGYIDDLE